MSDSTTSANSAAPLARKLPSSSRRRIASLAALTIGGAAAFLGGIIWLHWEWETGRFVESTNDAYLKADSTIVAPKVSGYILSVLVQDNQQVEAGQPVAVIDNRDFKASLDQAQANVAGAEASMANLDAQIAAQEAIIQQARAGVTSSIATLELANSDATRYQEMAKVGYGSEQQSQEAVAHLKERNADLEKQKATLLAAQRQVDVLQSQRLLAQANYQHAQAMLEQAQLNLGYTTIVAPVSGTVGARSLREGQYVQAGTQLMAVVPLQQVYIVANFKETQLGDVEPGQSVDIHVDTFANVHLRGHVDSIAPVSGLEFSLLPPDNATGNFTKIVQRIPVKIVLDTNEQTLGLRPGMSVEAEIDTKGFQLRTANPKASKMLLGEE